MAKLETRTRVIYTTNKDYSRDHYTILGIDPGSTTLGIAILYLAKDTLVITRTEAFTLDATRLSDFKLLDDRYPDRERRLIALGKSINKVLDSYQPCLVGIEAPFFNRRKPSAYAVLVETLYRLRLSLYQYDLNLPILEIDPPTAKRAIGVRRLKAKERRRLKLTTKDLVREALEPIKALNVSTELDLLDEHSLDAIAVAYSAYKHLLASL